MRCTANDRSAPARERAGGFHQIVTPPGAAWLDHVGLGPQGPAEPVAARAVRRASRPDRQASRRTTNVSTESIASHAQPVGAPERCRGCGAPLAEDQRYCLECGERRTPMSSVLLGAPQPQPQAHAAPAAPPSAPPGAPRQDGDSPRGSGVTVIAGVGVLLLAMGVGVLIGRSGGGKQAASQAPQVITVSSGAASPGTSASGSEAATFSSDWPSGTSGYTVQLQTLPVAGTQVSAVEAAKSAASAKGAKGVGALKSEEFSSLPAGNYVIYSGTYHKRSEAQKALAGLKKSFPGASVVKVSSGASSSDASSSSTSSSSSTPPGTGSSEAHPAPPSVVESLKHVKGKSYEERSKNLPNVISTG